MEERFKDFSLPELEEKMKDRWWRINNLYYITNEKGEKILFICNPIQRIIYNNLHTLNIIPKARQLGVTTLFCILYLDAVLFSKNKKALIISKDEKTMEEVFRDKIKFAWENLPVFARVGLLDTVRDNATSLEFSNGSSIHVALSSRGGTVQYLHVSELGPIGKKDPEKAKEIKTGSLNSIHTGSIVSIESTAAGREGMFYEFCMAAEKLRISNARLGEMDYKIMFFPWWKDIKYVLDEEVIVSEENEKYFNDLRQKYGIELSKGQKSWYIKKKVTQGSAMFEEFPSTLDECFAVTQEGTYYGKLMERVYATGRIRPLEYDSNYPVDTYWDLGHNDFTVILFVQTVGNQIRFIDTYASRLEEEGLAHYVNVLKDKAKLYGYKYRKHVLPWDVDMKDINTGKSRKDRLFLLGLYNIQVAPKLGINEGIEMVRSLFSKFIFNERTCKGDGESINLIEGLSLYRRDWDSKNGGWKNTPKHDDSSHMADATRYLAVTWQEEAYVSKDNEDLWGNENKQEVVSFFA